MTQGRSDGVDGSGGVREALRVLAPFGRPYRKQLAGAVAVLMIAAAAQTAAILVFGEITDNVLVKGDLAAFWKYASVWAGLAVVGAAATFTGGYLTTWIGEQVVLRLRDHTFTHLQQVPAAAVGEFRSGDLLARLTSDVDVVEELAASGVVQAISGCGFALFFAAAAFWVRWDLALAVLVLAPLFWLASRALSARMTPATREERAGNATLTATVSEALGTLTLAQLYNRQAGQAAEVHAAGLGWLRAGLRQARVSHSYPAVWELIETCCVVGILGMGGWEISAGRLSIGGLLAFAAFLGYLYPVLRSMGELAVEATGATVAADRLRQLWELPVAPALAASPATEPESPSGPCEVRLDRVSFRHPGAIRPVASEVSVRVRPGELVALTGPSGTGKSTLAALLVRLLEPDTGRIRIGGRDAGTLDPCRLRELVSLLPQRISLLHRSVAGNIGYGRPEATRAQLADAARAAGAHEFITALPDGYDTIIGADGHQLSGGQARRIALARTLLRASPVLVLDEPTAGLDAAAAETVLASIRHAGRVRARTTILITHDPDLAARADRILVLADGRVSVPGFSAGATG